MSRFEFSIMPHIDISNPDIPSPRSQVILSTTMVSTESQQAYASLFHTQLSTVQKLLEDVPIEALTTRISDSNSNTLSDCSANDQEPLLTFTLFPLLPTELRLRVWRLAIFPRVVSFVPGGGKAPSVLSACRESRTETRKMYRLCIRPSSPIIRDHDPLNIVPDYGFFINYDVDILHINPLCGFQNMIGENPPGTTNLNGHSNALRALNFGFSLWHLPTKKILFELPAPQAPAAWSSRILYSSWISMAWGALFWRTAILCPLLEEIMLLQSDELEANQANPVHMVFASSSSNAAFLAAAKAFTEAEMVYRGEKNFFSGVRTEKEASQRIMEIPKAPEGSHGRFSKYWWENNPRLTFVEIEE